MRYLLLLVAVLFSLAAHGVDVDSRVDAATVYRQGATVSRMAEVTLKRGENQLDFINLSAAISEQRFQIEVDTAGVELGQVRFEKVQEKEAFDATVRKLRDKIKVVERQISALDDATETANLKLRFLDGIAQGYAKESWFEGARGNADISSWRSALQVLDEGATSARATIRDNAGAKVEAEQERSVLQRELAMLRGGRLASLRVSVTAVAEQAGAVIVKLHYFLPQASWSPLYEARLDSDAPRLQLLQKAVVSQTTDEEWTDARLRLSTSEPSGALEPPELDSEFLDLQEPVSLSRMRQASPAPQADMMIEEVMVTGARIPAPPEVDSYAVSYPIPGRVSVPNDANEEQTFALAKYDFAPQLITRIVPRESMESFLTARFTHDEDVPLYSSRMLVFVDRVFVGETWMPTALPQDEITLPVGQDRRVEFTLRNQGGQKGEGGFIGRRKQQLYANLFEITNRRATPTTVEVVDRYPVAVNEDIEVTVPKAATQPTEKDVLDKPGVIAWRKVLQGGETWRISHQYEVSHPAGKTIVGNTN